MNDFWTSLVTFLIRALTFYTYVMIASVIVSFLRLEKDNPLIQTLTMVTEPFYQLLRKVIPTVFGNADIAPMVGVILVQIICYLLDRSLWM
ncbi:MAG: YggT family protein [Planctomycetota bacterium]|nr:YggT family protein [Planctomycetota bacterium]MDA1143080.1 YggT family protein [Planctomycetota bacterium]